MQQIVAQVFQPDALTVHSLTGLVGYVEANRDELELGTLIAHVVAPCRVELIGAVEPIRQQRSVHCVAVVGDPKDICVGWQLPDQFTIMVKTGCVPDVGDIDALIRLVGNVKREQSVDLKDDGMAQTVESRAGVAIVERSDVPNPVTLAPYRSFRELDQQVESPFLIRFQQGDHYSGSDDSEAVVCRLFECDGGSWQNDAREKVADYLRAELPDGVVVIA